MENQLAVPGDGRRSPTGLINDQCSSQSIYQNMRSRLVITAAKLDTAAIANYLQLKGKLVNDCWIFDGAARLSDQAGDAHATYWVNLLDRHRDGKNALMAHSHQFTVEFFSDMLDLNENSIDGLARNRVAIRFNALQ